MGECRAGTFTTNEVVTHGALVCFGGFGQPRCEHLEACLKEHGRELYSKFSRGRKILRVRKIRKSRGKVLR